MLGAQHRQEAGRWYQPAEGPVGVDDREAGLSVRRRFPSRLLPGEPGRSDGRVGVHEVAGQHLRIGSDDRLQRDQPEQSVGEPVTVHADGHVGGRLKAPTRKHGSHLGRRGIRSAHWHIGHEVLVHRARQQGRRRLGQRRNRDVHATIVPAAEAS